MNSWQDQKQLYDKLQQQHRLDVRQLMHEAKLNSMPNEILQGRLNTMRKAFDNKVTDLNRPDQKNY